MRPLDLAELLGPFPGWLAALLLTPPLRPPPPPPTHSLTHPHAPSTPPPPHPPPTPHTSHPLQVLDSLLEGVLPGVSLSSLSTTYMADIFAGDEGEEAPEAPEADELDE
jgi:hypothetical protein